MTHLDWHANRSDNPWLPLPEITPGSSDIDLPRVRKYRLERVRGEMARQGVDALILSDPVNIRYTTGTRNMQVFSARNAPARYLLVTPEKTILFEFTGCNHLADGFETVDEVRPALTASFVAAGPRIASLERSWAEQVYHTLVPLVGSRPVIGMERINAGAALALAALEVRLEDAQSVLEMARAIKSPEEVKCVIASLRSTESAVEKLRTALRPGITENQLWSVLLQSIIADDGDYCETRLPGSGPRTNPWFQEAGNRGLRAHEPVGLDTHVVGSPGHYAHFSRTFHPGPHRPRPPHRHLYPVPHDQRHPNTRILQHGPACPEHAEPDWEIPQRYFENRYYLSAHGCGMTGEYPYLYHRADFSDAGYEGVLQPGMVICVESYIGEVNGREGVKLEEQVLITNDGVERLSRFPFEPSLL